jgi:hypothetical protein
MDLLLCDAHSKESIYFLSVRWHLAGVAPYSKSESMSMSLLIPTYSSVSTKGTSAPPFFSRAHLLLDPPTTVVAHVVHCNFTALQSSTHHDAVFIPTFYLMQ